MFTMFIVGDNMDALSILLIAFLMAASFAGGYFIAQKQAKPVEVLFEKAKPSEDEERKLREQEAFEKDFNNMFGYGVETAYGIKVEK